MKHTHYLYIGAALAILSACSDNDLPSSAYTVGEENNVIALTAGMAESATTRAITRADEGHDATSTGGGHKALTEGIKASLQVSGTWTGKGTITKTTTATIGAETTTESKHNNLSTDPVLYWDDYGTADPANASTGRTEGLTIYGVAVNKANVTAPTYAESMTWTLDADQSIGWDAKDLLITNNVSGSDANRYNFSERKTGKLLEFNHAMSKVTINLTAGKGFVGGKFVNEPTVSLHGFPTSGSVDVTNGNLSNAGTVADVTTHRTSTATWASANKVTRDAIVFPTRDLTGTIADNYIAKVVADGNVYYVDATNLLAAMPESNKVMQSGVNYILNITVNKTEIKVTATIKDWTTVEAETDEPVINVSGSINGTATEKKDGFNAFDFYLSDASAENAASLYAKNATATAPTDKEKPADGAIIWPFDTPLYWPSHSTHYFMRGVYPILSEGHTETTVSNGKINVTSGDYNSSTFPSNLLVGAPEFTDANKMCNNSDHASVDMSTSGICAREGTINLHFNYMMSQVEVHLTTPESGNDVVNLTNAKVEIVNGYTQGDVNIHTKAIENLSEIKDFTLGTVLGEGKANYRHSIVVPQSLNNGTDDLKFKITITNTDGTKDIYYATIKSIKVKEGSAAPATISAWQSGMHYVYTLDMRKTEVKVSASITDWITVKGSDEVWF